MNESRADDELSPDPSDADERVGEAVEAYLALAEQGNPPELSAFADRSPDMRDDVRARFTRPCTWASTGRWRSRCWEFTRPLIRRPEGDF
jgi:hypothetical protein